MIQQKPHTLPVNSTFNEKSATVIARLPFPPPKVLDSFLDGLIDRATFTVEITVEKAKLMSQKNTLEEQKAVYAASRADWLEPFENWIKSA